MGTNEASQRGTGIFLSGKHVSLTALSEQDVLKTDWFDWFNDEETTHIMQQHYFPNSRELQLKYYRDNLSGSRSIVQLGVLPRGCDAIVGVISLGSINYISRKAELSMIIGEKKYRNVTCSVEAMALMVRHGFDTLNLHRIWGGSTSREIAELMCRTLGFRHEGVLRQDIYKNGRYLDVHNIGLLRHEFTMPQASESNHD